MSESAALEFANKICAVLDDKKAVDITLVKVGHLTDIAEYMVIACGKSTTQVRALAEHVDDAMEKEGIFSRRKEGFREGRWALLDYSDVIVHIFLDDVRLFYCLEELWGDGSNVTKFGEETSKKSKKA